MFFINAKKLRQLPMLAVAVVIFSGALSAFAGVTITSPTAGATVSSPTHFVAYASSGTTAPITAMRIYVNSVDKYTVAANSLSTYLTLVPGSNYVVVQAWDSNGVVYKSQENIVVAGTTTTGSVSVSSPTNGGTAGSPIHFVASATSANPITAMRIYLDNVSMYTVSSSKLDTYVPAAQGTHYAVVQAWDSTGAVLKSPLSVTVGSGTSTNTVSVAINPASVSLKASQSQQFAATVSGTSNTAVDWLVNGTGGGSASAGYISSGGLYTAPATAPSSPVTVTAESVYDTSRSASATVNVTAPTNRPEYYVAPNGSDSASGSASSPWATLAHASSAVSAGALVHVAAGTYTTSGEMHLSGSGTPSSRVSFVSDTKWGAKLVSTATGNSAVLDLIGNYIDVEGFDITGSGAIGIYNTGSYNRMIGNLIHNIPATGCTSNGGGGILDSVPGTDADAIGNVIHDIGDYSTPCPRVHGIYHGNVRGHIYNNITYRNQGWGIHNYGATTVGSTQIANNTVFSNGWGGILIGASGTTNDYAVVTNNIVYNNGTATGGISEYGSTGIHNQYLNNLVYGNGTNWGLLNGLTASGTITADPQFVNYQANGTGNYQLQSTSPAIDKGTTQAAPSYDFSGGPRPMGNGIDIGAYEYSSTPAAWPFL